MELAAGVDTFVISFLEYSTVDKDNKGSPLFVFGCDGVLQPLKQCFP